MPKISALPPLTTLADADVPPIVDDSTSTTKKFTLTALREYLDSFIKPSDSVPFDYIVSGAIWTGDSYAVNRNASMTAAVLYIGGRRHTVALVTARTFTASRDTYVDALSNGDGTATLVYTEVANNAASPTLAANSVRLGIIVTGASTIASVASINQGQENKVLPIASSIAYTVTDSLGNLICPRDPNRKLLGYRQIIVNFSTTSTTPVQITGLSAPVIIPLGRKIKVTAWQFDLFTTDSIIGAVMGIWEGTVGSGTELARALGLSTGGSAASVGIAEAVRTPASASLTYNAALHAVSASTATVQGATNYPIFIKVELE